MELASAMASQVNSPEVTEGIASAAARGSDVEKEEIEENLSAIIGRTGFFHRTMFAYETVAMLCLALHNLVHGASASDEDYWCRLPDPPANMTLAEWRDMNIPREGNGTMSRCLVYSELVGELPAGNVTRVTVPCSARVFNVSDNVRLSIVKQWDLTCERTWLLSASETVYTAGSFIGLMLSGLSADRIGRKPTICFSAVVLEVVGISLSSVGSVFLFMCHRFFVSAAIHAVVYTQYIMLVEVVAMQWRSMYMTFVAYGYIIGVVITVFTLGDNVDWRNKQAIVMLPTTFLLCGFYLLPESPRWSLTNLHVEEAVHAVAYILRCNRATPDTIRAVVKKLRVEPLQTLHGRMSANEDASQYLSHRRKQAPELSSPEKTVWELLVILITQYQFSSLAVGFCCAVTSRVNSREITEGIASGAARGSDVEKEENLSAIIGRTGFFHCTIFAYETIATLCLTLHNLVHDAGASDEDYWCRLPDPPANRTLEEWRDVNIPRNMETDEEMSSTN
ncbi:solute carrier family 22 member 8-like [Dermacentor silvarum]|uniref:solute carrier family 22 member 8-like n=1 Tax=Dermacentor silvarum TaxID=543639 RepID=UPI002100AA2B|nr:solute carrier family 22 member 8-like [Dermacentor silvarum]